MTEDFFMRLCDVYGFAPSRALRELVDAAIGQAVVAERHACARLCELQDMDSFGVLPIRAVQITNACAATIRARGKQ